VSEILSSGEGNREASGDGTAVPGSVAPAAQYVVEVELVGIAMVEAKPAHPPHHLTLLGLVESLMTIIVVAVFVIAFIAQPFRIPSESMEPTLLIGDFVLVDKVAFAPAGNWGWLLPYGRIQRGDPVVFHSPTNSNEHLVKRVIAIPGDHLHLDRGEVFVNGQPLKEPYALYLPSGPDAYRDDFPASLYTDLGVDARWWIQMHKLMRDGELVIPEGDYFVLGDNRNRSLDSRYWGFVPRMNIEGRPEIVYFSVRSPSPDDEGLGAAADDRMNSQTGAAWSGFARWDRMFHVVR
jgi:signal peptidase I